MKLNVCYNTFLTWTATTSRIIAGRENGKAGSFPAWLPDVAGAFLTALEDQVKNFFCNLLFAFFFIYNYTKCPNTLFLRLLIPMYSLNCRRSSWTSTQGCWVKHPESAYKWTCPGFDSPKRSSTMQRLFRCPSGDRYGYWTLSHDNQVDKYNTSN